MRAVGRQIRGVIDTIRMGRIPARTLAIADSRALVRSMFLASAAQIDLLPYLRGGRSFPEIVDRTGCARPDRLRAWLWVGAELGELWQRGEEYGVRGRRSRALADGDQLLTAHYRSMLEYQVGPYGSLDELLRSETGQGRSDLTRYAEDIAQVSLAAAPFVASFVRQAVAEVHPANVLDVGCGTAVYTRVVLDADAHTHVEGIDLAENVIVAARQELDRAGYGSRVRLHVGDVRRWAVEAGRRFDLVMLLNNIYYFDQQSRVGLYQDMGELLTERGQLVVVSMLAPGSVAAAHLHFMLTCQAEPASLPGRSEIESELGTAGFQVVATQVLVPTEPFVGRAGDQMTDGRSTAAHDSLRQVPFASLWPERTHHDQWESETESCGEGLTEHHHPQQNGNGRIEIRDDRRPGRSDLGDEGKEEHKGQSRADERQRRHGEAHLGVDVTGVAV